MAFLRNRNGSNYKIISSRRSAYSQGHNDYLVRAKNGDVYIACGWHPKEKAWMYSRFYGNSSSAIKRAQRDFSRK